MKILAAVVAFLLGSVSLGWADEKVPRDVTSWYADVLTLYKTLDHELSVAPDKPSQVKAFEKAAASVDKKHLQTRYDDLVKNHPNFFGPQREANWTAPQAWADAADAFTRELSTYTFRIPILSTGEDPELTKAAAKLAQLLSGFSGD